MEVALGGGRLGLSAAMTEPGRKVVNRIRGALSKQGKLCRTDDVYGGPYPVENHLNARQREMWDRDMQRDAWAEQYFSRRPQLWELTPAPDYVSASQRITVLPLYQADDHIREELSLTLQEVHSTIHHLPSPTGSIIASQ